MFRYQEYGRSFVSRHHLINHVDMVLGLSDSEKKMESQDKVIVIFDHDEKKFSLKKSSELSNDEMLRLRKEILLDSIYATKCSLFVFTNKRRTDAPHSIALKNDDDIKYLLACAINIWEKREGSWAKFVERTSVVILSLNWDAPVVDRIIIEKMPNQVDIDSLPLAVNNRRVLANSYSSDESWKVFTERICKNEFVKFYLREKQNNLCPVCKAELDESATIHHVDYDHKCSFCNSGLKWRMPRTRVQPHCELCYYEHREWFEQCVSRLKLVHNNCNYIIDHLI